jgi:predicted peroxiredoxin
MFLTQEAVHLSIGGNAQGVACDGCPPLERLFADYAADGGRLFVCPICFDSRKLDSEQLVANAQIAGATPLWQWIGDGATVFSY